MGFNLRIPQFPQELLLLYFFLYLLFFYIRKEDVSNLLNLLSEKSILYLLKVLSSYGDYL